MPASRLPLFTGPKLLKEYVAQDDSIPFRDWMDDDLRDERTYSIVLTRLKRLELGLLGDCEPVGTGVSELRIDFGPGFRVYFGLDGNTAVLLLGGTKASQQRDIRKAKAYWEDYNA